MMGFDAEDAEKKERRMFDDVNGGETPLSCYFTLLNMINSRNSG